MTNIELFMENQAEENRRAFEALKQFKERLDQYEEKGDQWIEFFKHLNTNRMEEIYALKHKLETLEKKIMEPIAQRLVDQTQMKMNIPGTNKYTHLHFCKTCHCHEEPRN